MEVFRCCLLALAAQAIFFTNPIWSAMLAGPVLGESVSAFELGGIALGTGRSCIQHICIYIL